MFIHTVYFWTKAGVSDGGKAELLRDCREILGKIPSVRQLFAGLPIVSERPVVDGTYAVGLTVIFEDAAGHDVYQPHPLHEQFISRNKEKWEKVVIYDFDSAGP